MKDYTRFMKWAVVSFIRRDTQDDKRDKIQVAGLFASPVTAEDSFIPHLPNKDIKRYIVHIDDLERFEEFYNFLNDLKEKYNDYWIYHLDEKYFTVDEQNKFRTMLNAWTN
ncbi:MAG: hypothetical protein Q4F24_08020 [Eubacteriales bacterium]|nr:hypothetical protein [Eubacteriales bacterium]